MKKLTPEESKRAKKKAKLANTAAAEVVGAVLVPFMFYRFIPEEWSPYAVPVLAALSVGAISYAGVKLRNGTGCPSCGKSTFRIRGKYDRRMWPYCMHCGSHIYQDLPTLKLVPQKGASHLLIVLIAIVGGVTAWFVHELEMPVLMWAGIIAAFSGFYFYNYLNSVVRTACKSCHHPKGQHPYCENCGEKENATTL